MPTNRKKTTTTTKKAVEKPAAKPTEKPAENKGVSREVLIVAGICVSVLLELANFDILGMVGGWLKYAQFGLFGCMGYAFPVMLFIGVLITVFLKDAGRDTLIYCFIFFLGLCTLVHLISGVSLSEPLTSYFKMGTELGMAGGIVGGAIAAGLNIAISKTGAYVVIVMLMLFSVFMIFRKKLSAAYAARQAPEPEKQIAENDVRSAAAAKRSRVKGQPVYETEEDGTIIRIVKTPAKRRKVKRAQLNRTKRKATKLRDGTVKSIRSVNKAKGVVHNTSIIPGNAGGDEIHEITNLRPEQILDAEVKAKEPKKAVLTITDVKNEGTISRPAYEGRKRTSASEKAAKESEAHKQPLSGKTLSGGEAVKTFTPSKTTGGDMENFKLPPIELLARQKARGLEENDANALARRLEVVLENFGVNAKVIDKQVGPSVTRFELQPELGTRVNKITSLTDDLKLNLAAPEIRIEAPIPGRAAIGIEIPNKTKVVVSLRELLEVPELANHKSKIAFAAGKDISGNVIVADLAKMPHLLIAGTTGSGKSVFLNTIIMCILYRAKPSEVGMIIIDPKRVEFGNYAGIPHLMKDVVTDSAQAVSTLRWAVAEMTGRYQRMQLSGVRDFKTYNEKFDRGQINVEEENPRRMQQIVIVIDELADLMMVAAKEVENHICRLAQLARAAGIHMVVATQRPSVDVVTGLIKANIPARAALLVASGVDSRTIIDMVGAEKLLGNGDMLFYPTGYVKPLRVQGALVSDREIRDTVRYLVRNKTGDIYEEDARMIQEYMDAKPEDSKQDKDDTADRFDVYFYKAGMECIEREKASSSMIQRRFSIGFNRAARIIDQLYDAGVVGPDNGPRAREVLMNLVQFRETCRQLGVEITEE
ncbi:MAG: DNA translocase FtsK 4TM domain-containing protein [Lachnospiraceae bacterium]